jgi:glycine betaine/choline ABC-type transport system substrate-binding protein
MAQLLEQSAGIQARVGLAGHEPNHAALLAGDLDLYADYLGTALRRYLGLQPRRTAAATYRAVRDAARRRWQIEWLPAFGFNNTYAVIVPAALAQRLQLTQVSDLLAHAPHLRLGATAEFLAPGSKVTFAPGGYAGLRQAYGVWFGELVPLPRTYGATFDALGAGQVEAIVDFPVNPRMVSFGLVELRDDRRFFAPYFAAPVVSGAFLAAHPTARAALERLAGHIDNQRAARMNHAVEAQGRTPREVAAELVQELTAGSPRAGRARPASRRPAS